MSQLSALAKRFVDQAVASHEGPDDQQAWQSWIDYSDQDFPTYVAQIALHALSGMTINLESRLQDERLDPQSAAQIENDLGYIADIEAFFSESLYQQRIAYG